MTVEMYKAMCECMCAYECRDACVYMNVGMHEVEIKDRKRSRCPMYSL